jgi:diguanylate cyclase (GGDEF)-like protein/PAS domain S-box-containing protein
MRLRNWIAVVVSVVLLMAMGVIGILVNRSALRAADTVHRADSRALGVNNTTLAGQVKLLSAAELNDFATGNTLNLGKGNAADRKALAAFTAKTAYFRYGVAITDLSGTVLNATRTSGLPASADPGYGPLRRSLLAGQPGFSSIMMAGGVALEAVAVPIRVDDRPVALLVGFNEVAKSQLQAYLVKLSAETHVTTIVDSTGRIAATSQESRIGTMVDPALVSAMGTVKDASFVEYRAGGTDMIAIVVPGMPGGWAYIRSQTVASFDGAVHQRSQTLNLTLLAMLLIGVVGISVLGYRSQVQRRRADERFRALFQHAPDMVAVLNGEGRIAYSSPSASAALGNEPGALQGHSVFEVVHPDDRAGMRQKFSALLGERDGVMRLQCRVMNSGGGFRWFEFTASNQMHNPALLGVVINARDVSENRAFQERLAHEAQHDPLTGLPNRRRMQDVLGSSLRTGAVAVLFVDLDGFKPVNDVYGHEAGDELLRQVAERLGRCVRGQDVLSRVGGDEFVVLMPGVLDPADAETMSARVRQAIEAPFRVQGHDITIGASVGVHLAPSTSDPDEALRSADHAMYTVKHAGGGRRARRSTTPVACTGEVRVGRHRADA